MGALINKHLIDDPSWALHWQMSSAERLALCGIAARLKPDVALEIGTYQGGSLQVLACNAKRVISLDIDEMVKNRLAGRFGNVEFLTGNSGEVLDSLVDELNRAQTSVGLVLVDGDHSREGVRRDLSHVLRLNVRKPMAVLMHDTFNPEVRAGVLDVSWANNPHVHELDLDVCSGVFFSKAFDTAAAKSMWGGIGCALLLPEPRAGKLSIQRSSQPAFEALFPKSVHVPAPLWKRAYQQLKKARRFLLDATRR
jgi:hypothetical protein